MFIGGGHGAPNVFTGQDREDILWVAPGEPGHRHDDTNIDLVRDRIVYLISCSTWAGLGLEISSLSDNTQFIGHYQDYIFAGFEPGDIYSRGFMESSGEIARVLINRGTIIDAYNAGVAKFDEWIEYWQASDDPIAPDIIGWLILDRDSLITTGMQTQAEPKSIMPLVGTIVGFILLGLAVAKK